jgi:hypothetical protein
MKNKLSFLLAATLAVTLSSSFALAAMPAKDDLTISLNTMIKGSYKTGLRFRDVKSDDWAIRFVTEASVKGIIAGDGYGHFRPSANVSHEEAVIMTVRAMGLTEDALALGRDAALELKDADKVSVFARPFVALAIQRGFLDKDITLNPQAHADREWITELVVRAMGLQAEAEAHMDEQLCFTDAAKIEADAIGYIAVAQAKGIILGYPDRTFRPNQPVKRSEMAAILCKAEHRFEYDEDRKVQTRGQLNGTIKAVTSEGLTFSSRTHQNLTLKFASVPFIFIGDKLGTASDLKAGMSVRLLLNAQGEIVFVHAKKEAPKREEIEMHAHGKVLAITAPQADKQGSITVLLETKGALKQADKKLTLDIAKDAAVKVNGETRTFSDVKVGDTVGLSILNNTVVEIDVIRGLLKSSDQPADEEQTKTTIP